MTKYMIVDVFTWHVLGSTNVNICLALLIIEGEQVEFDKVKRNILVTNKKDFFYMRSPKGNLKYGENVVGSISLPFPNTEQGTNRKCT